MKSTIFATVFAMTIAAVSAQGGLDISAIPSCATACAFSSMSSTSCSTTDLACICRDSSFIDLLRPCISSACSAEDQTTMVNLATTLCAGYGVTISSNILSATASASATPTNGSVSSVTPTATESVTASTSTGAAAKYAGSGFVAAAVGAAIFVL